MNGSNTVPSGQLTSELLSQDAVAFVDCIIHKASLAVYDKHDCLNLEGFAL